MRKTTTLSLLLLLVAPLAARGGEASPQGIEFFEKHIRPLLAERCYKCHSTEAEKVKGGLLLDSRDAVLKGGKDGVVLVPGEPEKSKLIEAIRYQNPDLQMPPKHPLSKDEVAAFEEWVKLGAPDPRSGAAPSPAPAAAYDYEKEKRFWSFQPVKDVTPPQVENTSGLISPIDYFLESDYESHRLHPVGAASKRALIRRATYDLTGLPPTPEEVEAFLADDSANAFEKVIDRLLASPHYGEQWGRHWLDLVRYADTSGCNSDYPVPQLYKYRNYVIDSFNKDKPYDAFLKEQLAGDLLPAKDEADKHEKIIATGYRHHNKCYSSWLAGAGVRGGMVYGKSDEFGDSVAENGVHTHDFHATILHLLGLNHEKLTFRHAGRDFRLTDVAGTVVKDILI